MDDKAKHKYDPLLSEDEPRSSSSLETVVDVEALDCGNVRSKQFSILPSKVLYVMGFILLSLLSFLVGRATSNHGLDERACLDTAWDEARNAVTFETRKFNPRFGGEPSPFMGSPTPEVDRLWYDLSAVRNYAVPYSVLENLNRTLNPVLLPSLGKYQVGMEVFHQLHCLNYVRMYTYYDHYSKIDYDMIGETPAEREMHKNHCVENLRQALMCKADLNVYTYHWKKESGVPAGNLFTSHRCIAWDPFRKWADENMARVAREAKPDI